MTPTFCGGRMHSYDGYMGVKRGRTRGVVGYNAISRWVRYPRKPPDFHANRIGFCTRTLCSVELVFTERKNRIVSQVLFTMMHFVTSVHVKQPSMISDVELYTRLAALETRLSSIEQIMIWMYNSVMELVAHLRQHPHRVIAYSKHELLFDTSGLVNLYSGLGGFEHSRCTLFPCFSSWSIWHGRARSSDCPSWSTRDWHFDGLVFHVIEQRAFALRHFDHF